MVNVLSAPCLPVPSVGLAKGLSGGRGGAAPGSILEGSSMRLEARVDTLAPPLEAMAKGEVFGGDTAVLGWGPLGGDSGAAKGLSAKREAEAGGRGGVAGLEGSDTGRGAGAGAGAGAGEGRGGRGLKDPLVMRTGGPEKGSSSSRSSVKREGAGAGGAGAGAGLAAEGGGTGTGEGGPGSKRLEGVEVLVAGKGAGDGGALEVLAMSAMGAGLGLPACMTWLMAVGAKTVEALTGEEGASSSVHSEPDSSSAFRHGRGRADETQWRLWSVTRVCDDTWIHGGT